MRSTWTDERLDDGFSRVDQRFDAVDRRFDEVDRRFGEVDRHSTKSTGASRRSTSVSSESKGVWSLQTAEMIQLRRDMNAGFQRNHESFEKLHLLLTRLGFGLGFSMFFVLLTVFLAAR